MVSASSQLVGVAVQIRGGSAIFDPLIAGFVGSAGLANALVGGLGTLVGARLWEGHFTGQWLFCWLWRSGIYSKKLDYQSGRPDLNRRPLDPQSPSECRWTWLEGSPGT